MGAVTTFQLPRLLSRQHQIERIAKFLSGLAAEKGWRVTVEEAKPKRSQAQNRYLWGVVYPAITAHLEGWANEDVHDYCLGECFGWEVVEGFGKKRQRPIKRSAKLSTTEFMDYIADIQQRMAEHGIYIPDANEDMEDAA